MNSFLEFKFPASEYTKVEFMVLTYFKFNLMLTTAAHMVRMTTALFFYFYADRGTEKVRIMYVYGLPF
jgi:hypothetical protein